MYNGAIDKLHSHKTKRPRMNQSLSIQRGIFYYLLLLIVMNLTYPIATYGPAFGFGYQIVITTTFVFGIYLVRGDPRIFRLAMAAAVIAFIAGMPYNFWDWTEAEFTWQLITAACYFGGFVVFQVSLIKSLMHYIFLARAVTQDVLYSAIAVYLLIATTFTPIYAAIEFLNPGAFASAYETIAIEWPQLVYYSFSTLTTLGYGDIVPINMWAKALAAFEAVIGVLYIAMLMARLVSLYNQTEMEEAVEEVLRYEEERG